MSEFEKYPANTAEQSPRDWSELISDDPIFIRALESQADLDLKMFDYDVEAINEAKTYTDQLNRLLLSTNGVANERVRLTGESVHFPTIVHDKSIGSAHIYTPTEPMYSDYVPQVPSVAGDFYGFINYSKAVVSNEPEDVDSDRPIKYKYKPTIGFQVSLKSDFHTTYFDGTLLAFGDVRDTNLEFMKDKRLTDAREALAKLELITDEKLVKLIQAIDNTWNSKDNLDPGNVQLIGEIINEHIASSDRLDQKQKDALLTLAKARLGIYDNRVFNVEVGSAVLFDALLPNDSEDEQKQSGRYVVFRRMNKIIEIKDIVFGPTYRYKDGELIIDDSDGSISFVFAVDYDGKHSLVSTPFQFVDLIKPIGYPDSRSFK